MFFPDGFLSREKSWDLSKGGRKKGEMTLKSKFAWTIFSLQFIFIIIYGIFAKYGPDADASDPKHNISPETGGQRPKDNIINKDYPSKYM